ncbi:MAG: hypothetical protein V1936_05060 [Patescibacteria group bacterium]
MDRLLLPDEKPRKNHRLLRRLSRYFENPTDPLADLANWIRLLLERRTRRRKIKHTFD